MFLRKMLTEQWSMNDLRAFVSRFADPAIMGSRWAQFDRLNQGWRQHMSFFYGLTFKTKALFGVEPLVFSMRSETPFSLNQNDWLTPDVTSIPIRSMAARYSGNTWGTAGNRWRF